MSSAVKCDTETSMLQRTEKYQIDAFDRSVGTTENNEWHDFCHMPHFLRFYMNYSNFQQI